jgi:NAD(P)-dependent dehydrogenase (short-subunit alcohol dehydrogenase family)
MVSTNKYAAAHHSPQGPGDARPTALQIIKDEDLQGTLSGKTVLITGTSSGIGPETARAIAATGATVYCAARDVTKAKAALASIDGNIELLECDLSSLESVRAAAKEFLARSGGRLNVLVNNAGVMAVAERTLTVDGYEMQFGTNHLGHFLLFQLLKPALLASSTPAFHSRVVNLTSVGHRATGIHAGNYTLDGEYDPWVSYGQAKTANIYMTNAIERHYGSRGLHGLAVHPGGILTSLTRHLDDGFIKQFVDDPTFVSTMKSVEQGAATTILAAVSKSYEGKGAVYMENCGEWGPAKGAGLMDYGYAPHAFDAESEERLWKDSNEMVGVKDD